MQSPLELGKQWFMQGVALFEQGHHEQAEAAFAEALKQVPGRASVLLNLGITRVHLGRHGDAIEPLEQALAVDPGAADAWVALGTAQFETLRWAAALDSLDQAMALGVGHPDVRLRRARTLARLGRWADALHAYQTLLSEVPALPEAWVEQGEIHREAGQWDEAAVAYRQGLAHGADPQWAGYLLAAVTREGGVPHPPAEYVRALFDQYADDFDDHLVGTLAYQGHQTLVDSLVASPSDNLGRVLDLGCGTGLCGVMVREQATRLVGIDLSPEMVERSRARGIYDRLEAGDLHELLPLPGEVFDTVLAADVFIYVGELSRAFACLAASLRPAGRLAFTVETGEPGSGARLLPSLRYSHAPDYIHELASRHGFQVIRRRVAPIRQDQGVPLMADYYVLGRE